MVKLRMINAGACLSKYTTVNFTLHQNKILDVLMSTWTLYRASGLDPEILKLQDYLAGFLETDDITAENIWRYNYNKVQYLK